MLLLPAVLVAWGAGYWLYRKAPRRQGPAPPGNPIALLPAVTNSGRKIFLYAAGAETIVVRWSAAALAIQIAASALLMPLAGATGAAVSLAIGEAAIWWPLRRTVEQSKNAEIATTAGKLFRLRSQRSLRSVS